MQSWNWEKDIEHNPIQEPKQKRRKQEEKNSKDWKDKRPADKTQKEYQIELRYFFSSQRMGLRSSQPTWRCKERYEKKASRNLPLAHNKIK